MKLVFIRHGDPDYVHDTLTARGWKEAKALAERVKKWQIDEIFCSPLGRAQDTARVFLQAAGREAKTYDWLREFHVRIADPKTGKERIPWDLMPDFWTRQADLYDKDGWQESRLMRTGPVAEAYKRVRDGIDGILAAQGYVRCGRIYQTEKGNEKTLVFFCHLGVQFVILSYLFGVSAPVMWQNFFVAPTSVTVAATEEREKGKAAFRCKLLGDVSHLYAAGITPSDAGFFEETYQNEQ